MKFLATRASILPESSLPDCDELIQAGRTLAHDCAVAECAFSREYGVRCEAEYKQRCVFEDRLMMHAQIGYRDAAKTRRAATEIHARLADGGDRVDRYGVCLDWSMGYPGARRARMPRGTGLILESADEFAELTNCAPVAFHFGDFVIGTPAAVENTRAALAAGATTIGNLGQYFTFRQPGWDDDVTTTAETVKALALIAAQPVTVMTHSNLDDGFAATLSDLASVAGMVLMERYIVEELMNGSVTHCYGHTFSNPLTRFAFQRVLAYTAGDVPGSMIYGNTTSYSASESANYRSLAAYLVVDAQAQRTRPTGHALNPVPVTEAERIPEIEEIVDAHVFANTLLTRDPAEGPGFTRIDEAGALAVRLLEAGKSFRNRILIGLEQAGIDTGNPFEMLLAMRRLGARGLEAMASSFCDDPDSVPAIAPSPFRETLDKQTRSCLAEIDAATIERVRQRNLTACVASSDVHEYGKRLLENLLRALEVRVIDGGVSVDADALAARAQESGADFIALSTYNGVALDYVENLISSLRGGGKNMPVFVGGKLNQILEHSNTAMPVDVSRQLSNRGALPCAHPRDMFEYLAKARGVRGQEPVD